MMRPPPPRPKPAVLDRIFAGDHECVVCEIILIVASAGSVAYLLFVFAAAWRCS